MLIGSPKKVAFSDTPNNEPTALAGSANLPSTTCGLVIPINSGLTKKAPIAATTNGSLLSCCAAENLLKLAGNRMVPSPWTVK